MNRANESFKKKKHELLLGLTPNFESYLKKNPIIFIIEKKISKNIHKHKKLLTR